MPGTTVDITTRTGPAATAIPNHATLFVSSATSYGPHADAVLVPSRTELEARFGADVTASGVYDEVETFYEEGGGRVYFRRTVGPDPVAASVDIIDAADADDTLRLVAVHVGEVGNSIEVVVAAGTVSGKKLTFDLGDYRTLGAVDDADIVLDNLGTVAAIVAAVNDHPVLGGLLVATDLASASVGADALPKNGTYPLVDGDADLANITVDDMVDLFPEDLGPGVFIGAAGLATTVGGLDAGATLAALVRTAQERRRLVLLPGPSALGDGVATMVADAADAIAAIEAVDENLELYNLGVAGYRVLIPGVNGGAPRVSSGVGYIAAARARAIAQAGPQRAPMGDIAAARWVLGPTLDGTTVHRPTQDDVDQLDAAGLIPFRVFANVTRVYGWAPLGRSADYPTLATIDVVNYAAQLADERAETLVGEPIDGGGRLFARLGGILVGIGEELVAMGAVFPETEGPSPDRGYSVDVGPSVNTEVTIAAGEVRGELAVRPTPTGSTVRITVAKVGLTAAV